MPIPESEALAKYPNESEYYIRQRKVWTWNEIWIRFRQKIKNTHGKFVDIECPTEKGKPMKFWAKMLKNDCSTQTTGRPILSCGNKYDDTLHFKHVNMRDGTVLPPQLSPIRGVEMSLRRRTSRANNPPCDATDEEKLEKLNWEAGGGMEKYPVTDWKSLAWIDPNKVIAAKSKAVSKKKAKERIRTTAKREFAAKKRASVSKAKMDFFARIEEEPDFKKKVSAYWKKLKGGYMGIFTKSSQYEFIKYFPKGDSSIVMASNPQSHQDPKIAILKLTTPPIYDTIKIPTPTKEGLEEWMDEYYTKGNIHIPNAVTHDILDETELSIKLVKEGLMPTHGGTRAMKYYGIIDGKSRATAFWYNENDFVPL